MAHPASDAPPRHGDFATADLGPLAWVLDELRKTLDQANKGLRRFAREADAARASAATADAPLPPDTAPLGVSRQLFHQAAGALALVEQPGPTKLLKAVEAAAHAFVQEPERCTEAAAQTVQRACFALVDCLQRALGDNPVSSVALFQPYKDVQALAGADRVHPADLFERDDQPWRWLPSALPAGTLVGDAPAQRAALDNAVLGIVRAGDTRAAQALRELSLGLAHTTPQPEARVFWQLAAALGEGLAQGLLPMDLYAKRAASRILLQYANLSRGDTQVSERLAQDLLFFCAQATPSDAATAPVLSALRQTYQLQQHTPANYTQSVLGLFDPALLGQARKRIASAKEAWSSVSGGDASKLRQVAEQFALVADSLVKLHPQSAQLAQTLTQVVDNTVRQGATPGTGLAMEVATAVLYLEASCEELDPADATLAERTGRLSQRLQQVLAGGAPEPLEPWMEALYRRVSDRQTMGSVVGELRASMDELERGLDQYFRQPQERQALVKVPAQLGQMRGVLSVLGLDQASQTVLHMRDVVERLLASPPDAATLKSVFEQLGNNLGALGFLIDMLNYQPALARKLFVFDAATGELSPIMGRSAAVPNAEPATPEAPAQPIPTDTPLADQALAAAASVAETAPAELTERLDSIATFASLADQPALAAAARQAASALAAPEQPEVSAAMDQLAAQATLSAQPAEPAPTPPATDYAEDDLLGIFLDEAREVLATGTAAVQALHTAPDDSQQLITLRRSFHTLKGSSRMVGLATFGEAAWALEQLLNSWLADHLGASPALLAVCGESLQSLAEWVEAVARHDDGAWQAEPFRTRADALRLGAAEAATPPEPLELSSELTADELDGLALLDVPEIHAEATTEAPTDLSNAVSTAPLADMDFDAMFSGIDLNLPGTAPAEAQAIADIDIASLADIAEPTAEVPVPPASELGHDVPLDSDAVHDAPTPVRDSSWLTELPSLDLTLPAEAAPLPEPVAASAEVDDNATTDDEQTRVIDGLRVHIPLYNVYLNEADEWSRRLQTDLSELQLELHRPVADSTVALAHSLAGSSATVGFTALSGLARQLEHALDHARINQRCTAEQAQVFVEAADDIRRLLHQFAAGFLKTPNPSVVAALQALEADLGTPPKRDLDPPADTDADTLPSPVEAPPQAAMPLLPVDSRPHTVWGTDFESNSPQALVEPSGQAIESGAYAARNADDELDETDAVDTELFPIFEEEAVELLPQLGAALRQWSARPDNLSARTEVLRVLHTLKGSARLAGALRLGELAHLFESDIESLGSEAPDSDGVAPLLARFDALENTFDALRQRDARLYEAQYLPADATRPAPLMPTMPAPLVPVDHAGSGQGWPASPAVPDTAPAQRPTATVRVRADLLERLLNQAGEVMLTRTRLEAELGQLRGSLKDLTGNLDRLRVQLRDVEVQAESQMQSRLAQAKEAQQNFDPLEFDRFTRVQELTRMMAESVNDVATVQRNLQRTVQVTEDDLTAQARQTRELQRDLLRTRMLEFEGISERLYRVVRQTSKETGKQVRLDIEGGRIEMDRAVLDRMTPAFEHLLRNGVVHGIETPEDRLQAGKPESGVITVRLRQEGNDVSVEFEDDGAGLNLNTIRQRAEALGLIEQGSWQDDTTLANLIFLPGFSTASVVTELAGRGIGMDVVRSEVIALGGRIETRHQPGRSTAFKLVLPLTTAVTQVVMLRIGTLTVGVPASVVELVRRTSTSELAAAYASGAVAFAGESVPFFWAGALLQGAHTGGPASEPVGEAAGKNIPVVVFRSAGQRVALHVNEVLGNQEVVVKNLGTQLSRLPGLSGITLLASGAVALIYNPVALAAVYGESARQAMQDELRNAPTSAQRLAPPLAPLVLVVDDSITVRRVTQRLLLREGYRVALAADGLQALERLQEERPAVVLSDIEMPRMDGFDLVRNIRADATLAGLPVVMITSRIAEKHREHARELGVDHYLGKPYVDEELLDLVRRYSLSETPA
ncbi:MAG: Hpt domain-containing protein [Pseudomonadota bacterium]